MNQPFYIFTVVNRAQSGRKAQHGSRCRIWPVPFGCDVRRISWRGSRRELRRRRLRRSHHGGQAILAIERPVHIARALRAQCLPAVSAITDSVNIGMNSAFHRALLPPPFAINSATSELPGVPKRSCCELLGGFDSCSEGVVEGACCPGVPLVAGCKRD